MLRVFSSDEGRAVFEEKFISGMRALGRPNPVNYGFFQGSDAGWVFGACDWEIVEIHRKGYKPQYVLTHVVTQRKTEGSAVTRTAARRFDEADDALVAMLMALVREPLLDIFSIVESHHVVQAQAA
jgi:hypothetical protein